MNVRLLSLLAGLALTLPGLAAGSDLAEVYARALQNDPLIREAEANRLAALESRPQALAALLPQVEASAGYNEREATGANPFAGFDGSGNIVTLVSRTTSDAETRSWDLSLRQSVFRWENWVNLGLSGKEVAQAELDYQAAQQDLMLRSAERYFNVLAAKDTLDAAEATLEALKRQLEQA
ncbi:MAG: TolC family protein, partial [Steroidobacteraceae bacterium]